MFFYQKIIFYYFSIIHKSVGNTLFRILSNKELKKQMKKINPKITSIVMLLLGVLIAGGLSAVENGAPAVAHDITGQDDTGV